MLKLLFKKWWVILIQGILLIILSIYIFSNPIDVLKGLSIWIGILVLLSGLIGMISWFASDKEERENTSLLWNIITLLLGLLILFNLFTTMKAVTLLFGIWMLMTGLHLIRSGLVLKAAGSFGLIMIATGVLAALAAIAMFFNIGTGAKVISILLGLQVLLVGIALIVFSLAKKMVVQRIKDRIISRNAESA